MSVHPEQRPQLDFGNQDTLYGTHSLHAFAAKCPPQLARWAIHRYTETGDLVADPMVGSGTTLVEAVLRGRFAVGADIDPLARLIAKVKSTPIHDDEFEQAIPILLSRFEQAKHDASDESLIVPTIHHIDRWFLPSVVRDLALLKSCIKNVDVDSNVRDLLFVAFSSLITARTSVANARDLVHSRHHFQAHSVPPNVGAIFRRRLIRIRRQMAEFVEEWRRAPETTSAEVLADDARHLSLADNSVDFVFTSPPYCNALDYTRAHTFSVSWLADILGTSRAEYIHLGRSYIGSERGKRGNDSVLALPDVPLVQRLVEAISVHDPRRAKIVAQYFADMHRVFIEIGRVLRADGRVVLVICPSHIRKVEIPSHHAFVGMAERLGEPGYHLECEDVIEREIDDRRRLLPYMQETFGRRMRTEYVVVLRKRTTSLAASPAPLLSP